MLYSKYPQEKTPEHSIQVRVLLESDIPFLPIGIANHFNLGNADLGVSLVAYEPLTSEPTFYGALLCKKRELESGALSGQGIELIEYSFSNQCNLHEFIKLLRKIVINSMNEDENPKYNYVYGKFTESACRKQMIQWYNFTILPTQSEFLYQTRHKIIEIIQQIEND